MSYQTPPPSHRQKSVDHLKAVEVARLELDDLYAERRANAEATGRLNRAIGHGLAAAKVHATLAVAEAISLNGPVTGPALGRTVLR